MLSTESFSQLTGVSVLTNTKDDKMIRQKLHISNVLMLKISVTTSSTACYSASSDDGFTGDRILQFVRVTLSLLRACYTCATAQWIRSTKSVPRQNTNRKHAVVYERQNSCNYPIIALCTATHKRRRSDISNTYKLNTCGFWVSFSRPLH